MQVDRVISSSEVSSVNEGYETSRKQSKSLWTCSLEQKHILDLLSSASLHDFEILGKFFSMLLRHTRSPSIKDAVQSVLTWREGRWPQWPATGKPVEHETASGVPKEVGTAPGAAISRKQLQGPNRKKQFPQKASLRGNQGHQRADRATSDEGRRRAASVFQKPKYPSELSLPRILCGANNSAMYGNCAATDYWALQVPEGTPRRNLPAYPGIAFPIHVFKKDAYNQTILSDSSSVVQIRTSSNGSIETDPAVSLLGSTFVQLEQGVATFSVQLKPSYSSVQCDSGTTLLQTDPFIYFDGQDTQNLSTSMQSDILPVVLSGGFDICPPGYVLVFDLPTRRSGPAQCQWCSAGTYSVSALASKDGFSNSNEPACLNCPVGGSCLRGGYNVSFEHGEVWILDRYQYRLVDCPQGTELVNSANGEFSQDAQQCRPCLATEYILHPDTDACQTCPPGLKCSGSAIVTPVLSSSVWARNGSVYVLLSCPAGFSVSSVGVSGTFDATAQQCSPCPKGEECVSAPCITCSRCQPNFYKPAATADACTPCPANTYTTQRGAQDLSACQPCPQGALCPDGSCALQSEPFLSCRGGGNVVGSWKLGNSSDQYSLIGCPDGYLQTSDQCQECPSSYYCSGGLSTPCPSAYFSLPGSSNKSSCVPSVFVVVVINLAVSRFSFDQTAAFQNALSNLARVEPSYVVVEVVEAGSDAATTDITSEIATSSAHAADALLKSLVQRSGSLEKSFATVGSQLKGASLASVEVTACIPGYELESQPPPSTCKLCAANYFCPGGDTGRSPCPDKGFSGAGANSSASCTQYAVIIVVDLSIPLANFTSALQTAFVAAVASSAGVPTTAVSIISIAQASSRRATLPSLQISSQISAATETDAAALSSSVDASSLNKYLAGAGLPPSASLSTSVQSSTSQASGSQSTSVSVIAGSALGGFLFVLLVMLAGFRLFAIIASHRAHKSFVSAISSATPGDAASPRTLPPDLKKYVAETVLGKGAFGCVIKARKDGSSHHVAIKIALPEKGAFDEKDIRRLKREASVHELFMSKKCEYAVHLAVGTGAVEIRADMCWLILEFLDGEDMHHAVHAGAPSRRESGQICDYTEGGQPVDDRECIKATRGVLAALKVMHAEGLVHRDVKPANIVRCQPQDGQSAAYKLIDFGSAIGVDEAVAKEVMMTLVGNRAVAVGTPPYMSPEMFKQPDRASYPTDVWSLGVTMFELVTACLPFHSESDLLWSFAVAGNMDEKAPDVLDVLPEGRRSTFDHNLGKVISRALKKHLGERYGSADEMHEAVYACLIERGEASYSAFISYRVASEAPLARLLFDELNHSITPGGHRVTVYWDAHRLVKGEDWEAGFTSGLLKSLCFLPLLSYGFTAPLASFPEEQFADLSAQGWEAAPVGRRRLTGAVSDQEDNCLKELMMAAALLEQARQCVGEEERACALLQIAYPIFVGRQQPAGHADYPSMGSFFTVQGGGGSYADRPSPPTARAVGSFLRDRAGFSTEAAGRVEQMGVLDAVTAMTRLQGCQLWSHSKVSYRMHILRRRQLCLCRLCYICILRLPALLRLPLYLCHLFCVCVLRVRRAVLQQLHYV